MKRKGKVLLGLVLSLAVIGSGTVFASPISAASTTLCSFETLPVNGFDKGITKSLNTDPQFAQSGSSLKIEPQLGYDLGTIQYALRYYGTSFNTRGLRFWAKAEMQQVVLSIVVGTSSSEYTMNVVVSNLGSEIILPYSMFQHRTGTVLEDLGAKMVTGMNYIYIKYFKTPIGTVYIDNLGNMEEGDVFAQTVLGPPDTVVPDPDLSYTPGEESSSASPMICNFSSYPTGSYSKGLKTDTNNQPFLIGNPAKADAGKSIKLEPLFGFNLSDTQFGFRLAPGKVTGSGLRFWARADLDDTVLRYIVSVGYTDGSGIKYSAEYGVQVVVGTTGRVYEVPFKDFSRLTGDYLNLGTALRTNLCTMIFKYYKAPISTIYLDSLQNMPYDEENESKDTFVKKTTISTGTISAGPDAADTAGIHDSGWKLSWNEEFNNGYIDTAVWNWNPAQNRNGELGYFTNRSQNSFMENGNLVIQSLKEDYMGSQYTSAELTTSGKKNFLYGKIEMYAKLPSGKGAWPAFWMLGESGAWPACGEVDIIEMLGGPNDGGAKGENIANGTLHWSNSAGNHVGAGSHYTLPEGKFTDGYHTIGIIWSHNKMRWYIDDVIYREADITAEDMTEFHSPMYLLLNTSVGGSWPGSPDNSTVFPMRYYIDYVRYYTYQDSPKMTPKENSGLRAFQWNAVSYLDGIKSTDTVAQILDKMEAAGGSVSMVDREGNTIDPTAKAATGQKLQMLVNGQVSDEATIVVYGDVDGSGDDMMIDSIDLLKVKRHLLKTKFLQGEYALAGSVSTKDGEISAADLLQIKRYLLRMPCNIQ